MSGNRRDKIAVFKLLKRNLKRSFFEEVGRVRQTFFNRFR